MTVQGRLQSIGKEAGEKGSSALGGWGGAVGVRGLGGGLRAQVSLPCPSVIGSEAITQI